MIKLLKKIVIIFLALGANGCLVNHYPAEYFLYKENQEINFPKNRLEIVLMNDTIGVFKNYLKSNQVFVQKFNYDISNHEFLRISNLDTVSHDIISLSNNDTVVFYKHKMLYFYNGEKKYLLYFRKK